MKNIDLTEASRSLEISGALDSEEIISFQTEIPQPIQQAMKVYGLVFEDRLQVMIPQQTLLVVCYECH